MKYIHEHEADESEADAVDKALILPNVPRI